MLNSKARECLNKIIKENIRLMLHVKLKQFSNLSNHLSFTRNGLQVTVEISPSLIQLLQEAAVDEKFNAQQNNGQIIIKIDHKQESKADQPQLSTDEKPFRSDITDIQELLALVVAIQCYPAG